MISLNENYTARETWIVSKIFELRKRNFSDKEIAHILNLPLSTIARYGKAGN